MYKNNPQALLFRDPRFKEYEARTFEYLKVWNTSKVIDIACGYGRFAYIFHPDNYTGFDFSEEMIKFASEKRPGYVFLKMDARKENELPLNNDLVFEVNSLHSLGMTPEQFYEKFEKYAIKAVACLEADRFTIFQKYGN